MTQIKGDGEAHPFLSPDDEFADYENWDQGNLNLTTLKAPEMLAGEYAREGLKRGLLLQERFGINPYKFGLVGATDSHTSLSSAEEDNFFGKSASAEPAADRVDHPFISTELGAYEGYQMVSSGYQGVWARENTREAIYDAMVRRETYATTGPRMAVRFFGGWESPDPDHQGVDGRQRRAPREDLRRRGLRRSDDRRGRPLENPSRQHCRSRGCELDQHHW